MKSRLVLNIFIGLFACMATTGVMANPKAQGSTITQKANPLLSLRPSCLTVLTKVSGMGNTSPRFRVLRQITDAVSTLNIRKLEKLVVEYGGERGLFQDFLIGLEAYFPSILNDLARITEEQGLVILADNKETMTWDERVLDIWLILLKGGVSVPHSVDELVKTHFLYLVNSGYGFQLAQAAVRKRLRSQGELPANLKLNVMALYPETDFGVKIRLKKNPPITLDFTGFPTSDRDQNLAVITYEGPLKVSELDSVDGGYAFLVDTIRGNILSYGESRPKAKILQK